MCADLGISPRKAHNLRRQPTLREQIRARVAARPSREQLSVTLAARLAEMHEIAPELTRAVAQRITTTEPHERALRDPGAFVHRTVVEDEHTYAVRIDDGACSTAPARSSTPAPTSHPPPSTRPPACLAARPSSSTLSSTRSPRALEPRRSDPHRRRPARARPRRPLRLRARPRARLRPGIWVINPVFMLDVIHEQLKHADDAPAREQAYFSGARLDDDQLRAAGDEDRRRCAEPRAPHADAVASNVGLGHDIRAG